MGRLRMRSLGIIAALRGKTDYQRWGDPRSFYSSWEPRTRRAAELVPKNSRVIEFGAGTRVLERCLDPSCSYVPSDLVDRGPGTLVCDLNERPLPHLADNAFDVAVMMGVLEYLTDVPAVIEWLSTVAGTCVVSYACADADGRSLAGKLGSVGRLTGGWLNSYSTDEFRALFTRAGFGSVHEEDWANRDGSVHRLFVFARGRS